MIKSSTWFLFLFALASGIHLKAQILPAEGRKLNYRIIGFSFPALQKETKYKVEIASGNYNDEISFKNNIVKILPINTNKVIAEVPSFSSNYTWRVTYESNPPATQHSELHHFSVGSTINTDSCFTRLRVTKNATKYKDAYVFLDVTRTLYDMKGNPVWYLPKFDGSDNENQILRDLKISPSGTLTFITGENAYEVNYNGEILWKGPGNSKGLSNDTLAAHYHHEITRLSNGHYMTLGQEYLPWKIDSVNNAFIFSDPSNELIGNRKTNPKMEFGTVIEYDNNGHLVWTWKSSDYYRNLPAYTHNIPKNKSYDCATHENAFFFDEKNKNVYVSFKNVSQVLKVKYPEGNVVGVFGDLDVSDTIGAMQDRLFCEQHSCNISQDGYLYLFNNNRCRIDGKPQIVIMQEPQSKKDSLKEIWEYQYPVSNTIGERPNLKRKNALPKRPQLTIGGNVAELPDRSIFASLCAPYSNIFIVSRDKKLLWDAVSERWNTTTGKWIPGPQYRASIITNRQELEQLIWNSEK